MKMRDTMWNSSTDVNISWTKSNSRCVKEEYQPIQKTTNKNYIQQNIIRSF